MLSDEEKKAIKEVKHFNELTRYWQEEEYEEKEIARYIRTILNLIEKQAKIIDKLYKSIEDEIGTIVNLGILLDENAREKRDVSKYIDEVQLFLNTLNYNYISKNKINPIQIIDLDGKIHNVYKIEGV